MMVPVYTVEAEEEEWAAVILEDLDVVAYINNNSRCSNNIRWA